MAGWKKVLIAIAAVAIVVIGGGVFLLHTFLKALAPPKVEITSEYISINTDLNNGFTIEKIEVDSFGQDGIPVKYTVTYRTSCSIDHPTGQIPDPPNKIFFNQPGEYWWTEQHVRIPYAHTGLTRECLDSTNESGWYMTEKRLSICPLNFEEDQWYFILIDDRRVTGIFFLIDAEGKGQQYFLPSGVSPI